MPAVTRRTFLTGAAAGVVAATLPPGRVLGANDDVRIAVLGCGGRGGGMMKDIAKVAGVRVVALCDADRGVVARRADELAKATGGEKPLTAIDYRQLLDRDDIDAVYIATPNHWHALQTIHACQAGKDVYVEKPASHTVWEGRQAVAAAARHQRVVQAGTQNRSDKGMREFVEWFKSGQLGKLILARGLCYRDRTGIGKRDTPLAPPAEVDYNLWLGPAADLPIHRSRFHYDWHWVWNTGNGDIGNQGPHETDLICWVLGDPGLPRSVSSFGGRFGWGDAGETPNMQVALFDFGGTPALFEVRNLWDAPDKKSMPNYKGGRVCVVLHCEGGYFVGGRGGGTVYDQAGQTLRKFPGDGGASHVANWIDACRSRKIADLRAPYPRSHVSSAVAHLANISYRLGQQLSPGALQERLSANPAAVDAVARFSDQLAAWKVDLAQTPWTSGPLLTFDPTSERFTGPVLAAEANALLHRQDRAPFTVPQLA
ncbi:MAG: Gfo/Idh/MocA family oxidoreductase [Fimbriimonadaceae bacterium]|nr:Gfo/Idh/MocA family oxidoreductase [Fimbriimonadaceae bacterium]